MEEPVEVDVVFGPQPPDAERKEEPLAYLPNLMPTYKTNADDGGDGIHMFSLVHQVPHVDQGWQPMRRGLNMTMLLVDQTTLGILERLGAVEWVPLPGGLADGAAGIFCHTPDKNAVKLIKDGVAGTPADQTVAAAIEASVKAFEKMTVETSAEEDRDADTDVNPGADADASELH